MINDGRGPASAGLALLFLAVAACGPAPLANTHPSADALAREVLSALAQQDASRLKALALNEEEFRGSVWPALPAARPERNLPFSYVWGELRQKSDARLQDRLAAHRGQSYELREVIFSGGATKYAGFTVHRDALLVVRDSTGVEHQIRPFGSAIEKDGRWKVFSFNADD
jgi:hypothetical protein